MKRLLSSILLASAAVSPAVAQELMFDRTAVRPLQPAPAPLLLPQRAPTIYDDVIVDVAGRTEEYQKTFDMAYMGYYFENMTAPATVVTDGDDIYIYNPVTQLPTQSYIKGIRSEGSVVFEYPQAVYYDYLHDQKYFFYEVEFKRDESGENVCIPVAESGSVSFTIDPDGSMFLDPLPANHYLAVLLEGTAYTGVAEQRISYVSPERVQVTPPEDMPVVEYSYLQSPDFGYNVKVGFDGQDVYFQGLSIDVPELWVKGVLSDGRIHIPNRQYMGKYEDTYDLYLLMAHPIDAAPGYELSPADTEFVIDFDEAAGVMTAADPDAVMFVNAGRDRIYYLTMLRDFSMRHQDSYAGVPLDPDGLAFEVRQEGLQSFRFNLPTVSVDGLVLPVGNLTYRLYVDGEPIEVSIDDFMVEENMEEVPYVFNGDMIGWSRTDGRHEIFVPFFDIESLGVQTINSYEGVRYPSDIVFLDIATGEISKTEAGIESSCSGSIPVSVEYRDISGRPVSSPSSGLYILTTRYSDGSSVSRKIMVR